MDFKVSLFLSNIYETLKSTFLSTSQGYLPTSCADFIRFDINLSILLICSGVYSSFESLGLFAFFHYFLEVHIIYPLFFTGIKCSANLYLSLFFM